MAAEGILANVVTEILKRVTTLVVEEIGLATGVKKELEKLRSMLDMILSVMTDAERKQWNDANVKLWMKDLKALAYEADDILDEFSYYKNLRPHNKVRDFFSYFSNMGHKIKNINDKFNGISSRRNNLGLVYGIGSSSDTTISDVHEHRVTYSHVDASEIFGRENDKLEIIKMLHMFDDEAVSVIPIVGMGGLGKTTLAQLVYKDISESIRSNVSKFDVPIWVCVTPTFNVRKIFENITESITVGPCEYLSNFNTVVERLEGYLKGKKFLLVLDDVWNLNQGEWDKLKIPLTVGAVGSKIIITTRSQEVASTVLGVRSRVPAYQLQRLQDSECWLIFTQKAFGTSGGAGNPPNLVAIGEELINKCGGLPLAANFLGNLLRNKEEREWLIIRDSEIWDNHVENEGNRILPVVKLSYDNLPPHLKQCFSYCSIFPKKSEINRKTLIQLWIAEGFLFQLNEMSMQEIGERNFKNLQNNSFFQDVHVDGETLTCTIHDLVHDLAQLVTGNEECLIVAERSAMQYISKTRRLRLVSLDEEMLAVASDRLNDAKQLRSLFVNVRISRSMNIRSVIHNNKRLRVLDLSGTDLEALPPSIGNLIHLRYLDISHTNIKTLPKFISKLYNLQTLKLVATKITRFPEGMEKLSNLTHFEYKA